MTPDLIARHTYTIPQLIEALQQLHRRYPDTVLVAMSQEEVPRVDYLDITYTFTTRRPWRKA